MATNVPFVEINLDKPRRMALTTGAVRRIHEVTGTGIGEADTVANLGVYIWAALVWEDRTLTLPEVEDGMIHLGNIEYAGEKLTELLRIYGMVGDDPLDSPKPKAKKPANRAKGKKPAA